MLWRLLADAVLVVHVAFVVFVVVGGFLALRWHRLVWIHVPAAAWGVLIELAGWVCPLTPLEHWLRVRGGEAEHATGVIDRFVLPLLYPVGLTRRTQWVLGVIVIVVNVVAYGMLVRRRRRVTQSAEGS